MGDGKWEDGSVRDQTAYCSEDGRFCGYYLCKMSTPEFIQSSAATVVYTHWFGVMRVRVNSSCEVMTACPSDRRICGERLQAYDANRAFLIH